MRISNNNSVKVAITDENLTIIVTGVQLFIQVVSSAAAAVGVAKPHGVI